MREEVDELEKHEWRKLLDRELDDALLFGNRRLMYSPLSFNDPTVWEDVPTEIVWNLDLNNYLGSLSRAWEAGLEGTPKVGEILWDLQNLGDKFYEFLLTH